MRSECKNCGHEFQLVCPEIELRTLHMVWECPHCSLINITKKGEFQDKHEQKYFTEKGSQMLRNRIKTIQKFIEEVPENNYPLRPKMWGALLRLKNQEQAKGHLREDLLLLNLIDKEPCRLCGKPADMFDMENGVCLECQRKR